MTKPKTAIVTGGGRGIGAAIARRLSADGYNLLITSTDGATARAVADELTAAGGTAKGVAADAADPASGAAIVDAALAEFGNLHVLVNNAGISSLQPFLELSLAEWQRVMDVNLTAYFTAMQAAARHMVGGGYGRIINISSLVHGHAVALRTAYSVSKAAINQLTRQAALELGRYGVTVNAVAPGIIETDMVRNAHTPEMRRAFTRMIPVGRYGHVDEIAATVAFLASEGASYISGECIGVDGAVVAALTYAGPDPDQQSVSA